MKKLIGLDQIRYEWALAKTKFRHFISRSIRGKAPTVLVYQMGRVGSSSILKTLHQSKLKAHLYHVHYLTPSTLERYHSQMQQNFSERGFLGEHLIRGLELRKRLDHNSDWKKWKIITLVRDPVATCLSGFFYHRFGKNKKGNAGLPDNFKLKQEISGALKTFFGQARNYEWILNWFDDELKTNLGIDVYTEPFEHSRGYALLTKREPHVLILRLEDLTRVGSEALGLFLSLVRLRLLKENEAGQRPYADLYRDVLKRVSIPGPILASIYDSKYVRHFYSADEIRMFKARWSGVAADPIVL